MQNSPPESIPLSKPNIGAKEREYVMRVLDSSRLALGPMLDQFEAQMAAFCGVKHAVAVNSGNSALHLIVRSLGIGAGDEVITTPFSFVASSNCLLFENAHPHFVDIDADTLCLDMNLVEEAISPATKGILGVDVFGSPAPWPQLQQLATQHSLHLIDDACEAPGARIGDTPIGAWGDAAAFGFYPNKQMTTGEGGCITTDNEEIAELCRSMRNQGRAVRERMEHVRLGYNYRMDELAAALGCAQLERLPGLLAARARVAEAYNEALAPYAADIILPANPSTLPDIQGEQPIPITRSWFVYVIRLNEAYTDDARDLALKLLRAKGIGCASYFPSIHLQPYYRERFGYKPGDFPVCESISNRSLALPFYPALLPGQIFTIGDILGEILPQLPKKVKTF